MSYRTLTSAACALLLILVVAWAFEQPWYIGIGAIAMIAAVALVHWGRDPLEWTDRDETEVRDEFLPVQARKGSER